MEKTVMRAIEGNEKAFRQLLYQHEDQMYRMAYIYVQHEQDALDVVQESALKAHQKLTTLQAPAHFTTWLTRIVINTAHDFLRKRGRMTYVDYDDLPEPVHIEEPTQLILADVLRVLSPQEKDVIILRFYYDYTISQTAEMLSLKLGTTKTILYRALQKLRNEMEASE
ncbi:sigma-70 family RNA polymerase sigma factor [Metalysinibacillus jejuensis]|uniref:sigma-70 family RNA polymerase sigma factor n=1 Tax=Metalysinibacillus jejuensis TaxID=914327 RepID=UPI000D3CAD74|nr:sigma-70 family RNA polymerase sigma factor [Metalysinibacillus jejuensis]